MKGAKGKSAAGSTREALKPADDRKMGKRKAPAAMATKRKARKEKKAKDPNKPKRPPSAFFVFLEDFRKQFKKENPNVNSVSAVGKAGGQKWKSLTEDEKAPFEAKAAKRKAEYEKLMNAYNKKQEEVGSDESEHSKSEVHDEDEGSAEDENEKGVVEEENEATEDEEEDDDEDED